MLAILLLLVLVPIGLTGLILLLAYLAENKVIEFKTIDDHNSDSADLAFGTGFYSEITSSCRDD